MAGGQTAAPTRLGALFATSPRRYLRRGDVLSREGESPDEVFVVHHGLLKLTTTGTDGCAALVAFRGAGELLGAHPVFDGGCRLTTAAAVTDAAVSAIDADGFRSAVERDPDLALHLLGTFSQHLRASTRHVLELASASPGALLARRIGELLSDPRFAAVRTVSGATVAIDMPISHEELASWSGISRRSVAAALRQLRSAGTISTGRMFLTVHDTSALEAVATGMGATRTALDP